MKKYLSGVLAFILLCSLQNDPGISVDLVHGWKFKRGDQQSWSRVDVDDSRWDSIRVEEPWENQGYVNYDGYAWYRIKVVLPSSIKTKSYLKDSIRFILGKIDDCDQFFLNGVYIGENNKVLSKPTADSLFEKAGFYGAERVYTLSVTNRNIRWDQENVIAVRVFDHGSKGGFWGSHPRIQMGDLQDQKMIDLTSSAFTFDNGQVVKKVTLKNTTSLTLKGSFSVLVSLDQGGGELFHEEHQLVLKPLEKRSFTISCREPSEAAILKCSFVHSETHVILEATDQVPYILTPHPKSIPQINGATVVGVRPNKPFLFCIPASGNRPMSFEAKDLPQGLFLDKCTGLITGSVASPGNYHVVLTAKNKKGEGSRDLVIKVGSQIMLTPPMGWNSWNCWGVTVDQQKIIQSAKAFKEKGLMNHGWSFINIDDGWEASRNSHGEIESNDKFPNMKALGDTLHQMGLKFGIYSSPGPLTCGNYTGSYQYEKQDAQSYARWGVDYLKYDWCSYGQIAKDQSLPELKKPYITMQKALEEADRDIVYSLCQYGRGKVWEWGPEVGGNLWRTTGDITDTWKSLVKIGFSQVENASFAGPGRWNDPDMLIVGWLGWGDQMHPTRLSINEQYTHISLWALLSAPMLIGCDLTRLDDFTLNLLTNDEVLALDQDSIGRPAVPVMVKGNIQVWVKELEDGNRALGIFNLGDKQEKVILSFSELGLKRPSMIRDLWRQKDIVWSGVNFETTVGSHGVTLVKAFIQTK